MRAALHKIREEWKQKLSWLLIWMMLVQTAAAGMALPVYAEEQKVVTQLDITDCLKDISPEEDAFPEIEIKTGKVEDGTFKVFVSGKIDDAVMQRIVEEVLEDELDPAKPMEEIVEGNKDKLAPAGFSFLFCGTGIEPIHAAGKLIGDRGEVSGKEVGTYEFTDAGSGVIRATFEFSKVIAYAYRGVEFNQDFSFSAEDVKDGSQIQLEKLPEGVIELTPVFGGGSGGEPEGDPLYSITKTAPSQVGDSEIEYRITARVTGKASPASLAIGTASSASGSEAAGSDAAGSGAAGIGAANSDAAGSSSELSLENYLELMNRDSRNDDLTFDEWQEEQERLERKYDKLSSRQKKRLAGQFWKADGGDSPSAEAGDLAGKWIVDELPAGLQVKELWLGDRDSGLKLEPELYVTTGSGGTFTVKYQIVSPYEASASDIPGQISKDGRVTAAGLTVVAELTDKELRGFNGTFPAKYEKVFKNTAVLKEGENDTDKTLCQSEETSTRVKLNKVFEKDGKPYGKNGNIYQWEITLSANSKGGIHSAYIIDWIDEVHDYTDDGLEIIRKNGGREQKLFADSGRTIAADMSPGEYFPQNKEDSNRPYDHLDEVAGIAASGSDAVPTRFSYKDTNTGKTYSAFIFPIRNYLNEEICIKYKTAVQMTGEYHKEDKLTLSNDAQFIYRPYEGEGPGPGAWDFSAQIHKGGTISYDVVSKAAGAYNASTQRMEWRFEVNRLGNALGDIVITDTFDSKVQQLQGFGDDTILKLKQYDRDTGGEMPGKNLELKKMDTPAAKTPGWSLKDNGDKTVTLTIHTGPVAADEYYQFSLPAQIVSPELFYSETGKSQSNTASYQLYNEEGTAILDNPVSLEAFQWISGELIAKDSIPTARDGGTDYYYDYFNHRVKWKITTNPYHIMIENQGIEDELPLGVTFAELTDAKLSGRGGAEFTGVKASPSEPNEKARYIFSEKNAVSGRTVVMKLFEEQGTGFASAGGDSVSSLPYPKNSLRITFSDSAAASPSDMIAGDSYTIEFLTDVDESYRDYEFKLGKSINLLNKAKLTGNVVALENGTSGAVIDRRAIEASDSAVNNAVVDYITKNGLYNSKKADEGGGSVDWELFVNRTGIDLGGAVITDRLEEWFDLDPSTLKFYRAAIKADGSASYDDTDQIGHEEAERIFNLSATNQGFQFTIPESPDGSAGTAEDWSHQKIVVKYRTWLTDDAASDEMRNSITIDRKGDRRDDAQKEADGSSQFDFGKYVSGSKIILFTIHKYSSNSISAEQAEELQGAEFTLTPMEDSGEHEAPDKQGLKKTKITNAKGKANFLRLERDLLYKIEETKAPDGYEIKTQLDPQFVVFLRDKDENEFPKGTLCIKNDITGGSISLDNAPKKGISENNKISFKKEGADGEPLAGVEFTLKPDNRTLKPKYAVSDRSGLVTFEDLDPGTYTLSETITNSGYKLSQKKSRIEVKLAEDGSYISPSVTPQDGLLTLRDGSYTAVNVPETANIRFHKYNQAMEPVGADDIGVTFRVSRLGDGGQYFEEHYQDGIHSGAHPVVIDPESRKGELDPDRYLPYLPCEQAVLTGSGDDAAIELDGLYDGTYLLEEQMPNDPSGRLSSRPELQTLKIEIRSSASGKEVTFTNITNGNTSISVPSETVDKDGKLYYQPEEETALGVVNAFKYGYVQVNKVKAEKLDGTIRLSDVPIAGAEFRVYGAKPDKTVDKSRVLLTLTTDAKGHLPVNYNRLLVNRQYYIEETQTPDGFAKEPAFSGDSGCTPFVITQDQQAVYIGAKLNTDSALPEASVTEASAAADSSLLYYNIKAKTGNILAEKEGGYAFDADGFKRMPLAGAGFELKASGSDAVYETAVSGEDGRIEFKNIPEGIYLLREKHTAPGYEEPDGSAAFEKLLEVREHETTEQSADGRKLLFTNEPLAFGIEIRKTDGDKRPLPGAEFILQAVNGEGRTTDLCILKEKGGVYTLPDPGNAKDQGLILVKDSDRWNYFTYSGYEDGGSSLEYSQAAPAIYYGGSFEYQVTERKAPYGYKADTKVYRIDRGTAQKLKGGTYRISNTADGELFVNEPVKGTLSIQKQAEAEDGSVCDGDSGKDLSGFRFLVRGTGTGGQPLHTQISRENITGADKIEITPDGIYLETGTDGRMAIRGVRTGVYEIEELESDKTSDTGKYLRSTEKWIGELKETGGVTEGAGVTFTNYLKRGTIAGRKVEAPVTDTSKGVEGALIGLFAEDTKDFTLAGTYLGKTALSGGDGTFRFDDVPYGTYFVAEISAPSGYERNDVTAFRVELSERESRQGFELTRDSSGTVTKEEAERSEIVIGDTKSEGDGSLSDGGGNHSGVSHGSGSHTGGNKTPGSGGKVPTGPGMETEDPALMPELPENETLTGEEETPEELPDENREAAANRTPKAYVVRSRHTGKVVYRSEREPSDELKRSFSQGEYLIYEEFEDGEVPLARFLVNEYGALEPLPLLGETDSNSNSNILWFLLAGSAAGLFFLQRKKRRKKE